MEDPVDHKAVAERRSGVLAAVSIIGAVAVFLLFFIVVMRSCEL
jgi:hypothetical protein